MTSWELAVRLHKISRIIPFAFDKMGAISYLDTALLMYSLDLDDVQNELIEHLENDGRLSHEFSAVVQEMLIKPQSSFELQLKEKVPKGIRNLLQLDNLRIGNVSRLHEDVGIESIQELKVAINSGKLAGRSGFGKRFVSQLQHHITLFEKGASTLFLYRANYLANLLIRKIKSTNLCEDVQITGDILRGKEEITNIDILCVASRPNIQLSGEISVKLDLEKSQITRSGFSGKFDSVNIRVHFCKPKYFGSAATYFTGPNDFYSKLVKRAPHAKTTKAGFLKITGDEDIFFKKLKLNYIPFEIREWDDVVEITENGRIWNLIKQEDIKGELHVHTTWSDGRSGFKELRRTAENLGLEYITITDHAENISSAKSLSLVSLKKQIQIIQKMNSGSSDFEFVPGIELNINRDGEVDYVFREGAVKLGAIHSDMGRTPNDLTDRYLKAIRSGNINIIAHPTGRKLKVRDEFDLNWQKIFSVCAENEVAIELNYSPDRMDVRWELARLADKEGCKFSIGGDIHYALQMKNINHGLKLARRAGLSKEKVLNCYSTEEIRKLMWNRK